MWIESLSLFDHHLCVTPKGAKRGNALSERALTMGCVSWRWEGRPLMDLLEDAREGSLRMKKAEVKLKKTPQQLCCAGVRGVRIYCVFDNFSSQHKREKRLWPSLGCIVLYCRKGQFAVQRAAVWQRWESNLAKCLSYTRELPQPPAASYLCLYYTIRNFLKTELLERHTSLHSCAVACCERRSLQEKINGMKGFCGLEIFCGLWIFFFRKITCWFVKRTEQFCAEVSHLWNLWLLSKIWIRPRRLQQQCTKGSFGRILHFTFLGNSRLEFWHFNVENTNISNDLGFISSVLILPNVGSCWYIW